MQRAEVARPWTRLLHPSGEVSFVGRINESIAKDLIAKDLIDLSAMANRFGPVSSS
jgi:hypothetical protein